jgi:hypothetical protein
MSCEWKMAEERGARDVSNQDFSKRFAIDWVRVWKKDDKPVTPSAERSSEKGQ